MPGIIRAQPMDAEVYLQSKLIQKQNDVGPMSVLNQKEQFQFVPNTREIKHFHFQQNSPKDSSDSTNDGLESFEEEEIENSKKIESLEGKIFTSSHDILLQNHENFSAITIAPNSNSNENYEKTFSKSSPTCIVESELLSSFLHSTPAPSDATTFTAANLTPLAPLNTFSFPFDNFRTLLLGNNKMYTNET